LKGLLFAINPAGCPYAIVRQGAASNRQAILVEMSASGSASFPGAALEAMEIETIVFWTAFCSRCFMLRKIRAGVGSRGHMKTILRISVFPALLLALTSAAYADSITLASYGTDASSSYGANNSALQFLGTSPLNTTDFYASLVAPATPSVSSASTNTTYNLSAGGWDAAIAGTSWVANTDATGTSCTNGSTCDPNDFYYYQTTFTAAGGTHYNGSVSVKADDTAEVLLNGTSIVPFGIVGNDSHCAEYEPSCGGADTVLFSDVTLNAGTNTLTIIDAQTGLNGAGVDFSATLTQTPEPGSLLLLGTGLLGLAFMAFRKTRHLGMILHS
jgi:hypothetical protein